MAFRCGLWCSSLLHDDGENRQGVDRSGVGCEAIGSVQTDSLISLAQFQPGLPWGVHSPQSDMFPMMIVSSHQKSSGNGSDLSDHTTLSLIVGLRI